MDGWLDEYNFSLKKLIFSQRCVVFGGSPVFGFVAGAESGGKLNGEGGCPCPHRPLYFDYIFLTN